MTACFTDQTSIALLSRDLLSPVDPGHPLSLILIKETLATARQAPRAIFLGCCHELGRTDLSLHCSCCVRDLRSRACLGERLRTFGRKTRGAQVAAAQRMRRPRQASMRTLSARVSAARPNVS